MTPSLLEASPRSPGGRPPELIGHQRPRVYSCPGYVSTLGPKAIDLAAMAGLFLDDWQQFVLTDMLGQRADGKWSAFEAGLLVSRQNGKGDVIAARELAGLFLIPADRLIIHSAHQFDTSLEAFERLVGYILGTPELRKRVKGYRGPDLDPRGISRSHGTEGITLKDGTRIRFRTRTKGGGRGFTCDCLILDEGMIIPDAMVTALLPTLSARPNPQIVYAGSAVDQDIHEYGVVLARIRERGHAGGDPSLAYWEWSAANTLVEVTKDVANDPARWGLGNPAMGIRITTEKIANERRAFGSNVKGFAVERLGVGDWPATDDDADRPITAAEWNAQRDDDSKMRKPITVAFSVNPESTMSAIACAGDRPNGGVHAQVLEHKAGTSWVAGDLADLKRSYRLSTVYCDPSGPAKSLIPEIEKLLGVEVTKINTTDMAAACGLVLNGVKNHDLWHLGTDELDAAVDGAATKELADALTWSRKNSNVDIEPLVSVTLAVWGNSQKPAKPKSRVVDLAAALAEEAERERQQRTDT